MKFDAVSFRNRFSLAYAASNYKSLRSLSLSSGFSVSHLHKIHSGRYDHSATGPGCFGIARVSQTLGVSPNFLLGFNEGQPVKVEEGATVEKMFRCYEESGGRLEGFNEVMSYCDVYLEPKDGKATLEKLGPLSLQSRKAGKDADLLQREYEASSADVMAAIYERQRRAWDHGPLVEIAYIDTRLVSRPLHARFAYIFAGFRVSTLGGQERLVVLSKQIA